MKLLWRFVLIASAPVWAQTSPFINGLPSREFGQSTLLNPLTSAAPNLIEGREFNAPLAIAFAPSGAIYVADSNNHRVLAWLNPADLTKGKPADLVIGQRDLASSFPKGPGSDLSSGLTSPSSVAVDSAGNLYVLDTGNNRIVRYPNPASPTATSPFPIDLVIGQKTQNSNTPNEGQTGAATPKPTEHSLWFTSRSAIALDSNGNLWVADNGNNRVLRFPVSQLAANTVEPAADKVLGQNGSFVTNDAPNCSNFFTCQTNLFVLSQPQSLAFDGNGALYIADGLARVLYYSNPSTQLTAAQVLGVYPTPAPGQQVTFPNDYSLGASQGALGPSPNGLLALFATGNTVFVADAQASRVVRYTAPASFTSTTSAPSPKIEGVIGQADLFSGKANRGLIEPDATTLNAALGGAFDALGNLWIADSFNNRVLFYPANGSFNFTKATGVGGQTDFPFKSPNLIEGKEVWFYNGNLNGTAFGGGIVVDKKSNPPHLYIADTFNNRILGFRDARGVGAILTQKADLVIGQPAGDFFRAIVNWPGGDPQVPTQTGLQLPVGLAVDDNGNVWVADSGNGRVLRFPAPFSVAAGTIQTADMVLGQSDFTHKDQSATDHTMSTPYGLAFFPIVDPTTGQVLGQSHLAVSDAALNRVLVFQTPFVKGETAFTVVGQKSFGTPGSPARSFADLYNPRNVATDTSGRLYVADSGNNRVLVFADTSTIRQTGPAAPFNFPFNQPVGIAVSTISGEMWVTSFSDNTIYHLPEVTKFSQNTSAIIQPIGSANPLAIALDSFENPVVAEAFNRVTFYFAQLVVRNAFSFTVQRFLTPGMWAQAAPLFKTFSASDAVHQDPPYPTTLSGLQMLVNGTPSAMYSVEQNAYINFVIPWEAPTTGTAEFLLYNPITKEIVAAGTVGMTLADPAIRTTNFLGWGQVMANNYKPDGTFYGPNGPQNPISQGDTLQLALTGQGLVANPPADGSPPPSGAKIPTSDVTVYINGQPIPSKNVVSVLDPTYPGSWTINVVIPTVAQNGPPPCNAASIVVAIHVDYFSNFGYDHSPNNPYGDIPLQAGSNACPAAGGNGFITTFAVK